MAHVCMKTEDSLEMFGKVKWKKTCFSSSLVLPVHSCPLITQQLLPSIDLKVSWQPVNSVKAFIFTKWKSDIWEMEWRWKLLQSKVFMTKCTDSLCKQLCVSLQQSGASVYSTPQDAAQSSICLDDMLLSSTD